MDGTKEDEVARKLFAACSCGDVAVLKELLEKEPYAATLLRSTKDPANPSTKKISERSIYAACSKGHFDIVKCLLDAGVDPNINSGNGTPIYAAAKVGHLDLVKLLVERGANYKTVQGGFSPLFVACTQGKLNVVKYLITRGANPYGLSPPLVFITCAAGQFDVVKYFIEDMQIDVNHTSSGTHVLEGEGEETLLKVACQAKKADIVRFLLQKGAIITPFVATQCSDTISKVVAERCYVTIGGGFCNAKLNEMNLKEVPWAFFAGHSSTLTRIDLQSNRLVAVPPQLFQMPALKELNISKNNISVLCGDEVPWQCSTLTDLDASHNRLLRLPYGLFRLPQLANLLLSNNTLERLPGDPEYITDDVNAHGNWTCEMLKKLDLSSNGLKALPDAMGNLHSLLLLDVSGNDLQFLPMSCTWGCVRLTHLDASKNQLTDLPFGSSNYWTNSLERLFLRHNKLTDISQNIAGLSHLSVLNLASNMITKLPPTHFWAGTCLRNLDLSNNRLVCLTHKAPSADQKTESFKERSIKHEIIPTPDGQPREFPVNLWASSLQYLFLQDNMIRFIPEYLSSLSALSVLNIGGNTDITFLPPKLGLLTHCSELIMTGVPISNVPQHLLPGVSRGGSAKHVLAYLRAQLRNCVPNNRMKLMVVGLQGRGKTTLLSVLRDPTAPLPENISTVGVNVADWVVKAPPETVKRSKGVSSREVMDVVFSTWDMAGQEVYYATHQCFLSRNTLYLVVWNMEEGEKGIHHLQPWLLNIQAQAPNSPVIIVGTHLDKVPKDMVPHIKDEYEKKIHTSYNKIGFPRLLCVTFISCVTKEGIRNLQEEIHTAAILARDRVTEEYVIGMQVPSGYVVLQRLLSEEVSRRQAAKMPPILDQKEFATLVGSIPNCDILDPEELSLAAQFLHDNGVLLHYNDHLKGLSNLYFIDPIWLANLLAQIITVPQKQGYTHNGILKGSDIPFIFKDQQQFPSCYINEYLQLLERYEIAFSLGYDQYLIPSMLPVDKPFVRSKSVEKEECRLPVEEEQHVLNAIGIQEQYPVATEGVECIRRRYKMAYIPSGFWSRLISRLLINLKRSGMVESPLLDSDILYWRRGILVSHDTGKFMVESMQPARLEIASVAVTSLGAVTTECLDSEGGACNGVDITVWSQYEDFTAMGYITDQLESLIEEWFPGLTGTDIHGQDLIQHQVMWKVPQRYTERRQTPGQTPGRMRSWDLLSGSEEPEAVHVFFPLKLCCVQALSSDTIVAERFRVRVPLEHLIPDLLMTDLPPDLKLDLQEFEFNPENPAKLLGEGATGKVYQGKYKGATVAIKGLTINQLYVSSELNTQTSTFVLNTFRNLRQEVTVLAQLSHPNIVALLGVSIRPMCIVLEFAPMGSLFGVLEKRLEQVKREQADSASVVLRMPGGVLGHITTTKIAAQVAQALKYLHSSDIIYRDLKADNILVWSLDPKDKVNVKLADYGISRFANPGGVKGVEGTPGYQAPETIQRKGEDQAYDEKVDVFSFAMVLFELLTGKRPFEELHSFRVNGAISEAMRPALHDGNMEPAFPAMVDLMIDCWQQSPSNRPTTQEVVDRISRPEFLCSRHTITTCKDHPLHKVDAVCVLSTKGHTPNEDCAICTWARQDGERHFSTLDYMKGTFVLAEGAVSGGRVRAVMVTEETNKRMWIGCGMGEIEVYRFGMGGIPRHLWSFKLNQTVLSILADDKGSGKITRIFAGLAKGTLLIFSSEKVTGSVGHTGDALPEDCQVVLHDPAYSSEADDWSNPLFLHLDVPTKSVKCMTFVGSDQLWCGCGNGIAVVDIVNMRVLHKIPVFVKNMALVNEVVSDGNAVWGVGLHLSCVLQWDIKTYSLVSVFDCSGMDPTGLIVSASPTEFENLFAAPKDDVQISDPSVKISKYETCFELCNEPINPSKSFTVNQANYRYVVTYGPQNFRKAQQQERKKRYSLQKTKQLRSYQCSTHATSLVVLDRALWIGRGMGDVIVLDISRGPTHGKVLARLATEDCRKYGLKSYHKLVAVGKKHVVSSQWLEKINVGLEGDYDGGSHQKITIWEAWSHEDIKYFTAIINSS